MVRQRRRIMEKSRENTKKKLKKLTLDKIIGNDQAQPEKGGVYAYPKSCKSGQHCGSPITIKPTRPMQL
jgi:hypothetical protein